MINWIIKNAFQISSLLGVVAIIINIISLNWTGAYYCFVVAFAFYAAHEQKMRV